MAESEWSVGGSAAVLGVALLAYLLGGCGFARMLPKESAVSGASYDKYVTDIRESPVEYTGQAAVSYPVVPFLVLGIPYDLDIVLVSTHPDWEMHEFARVRSPEGPIWLAKDTRATNGDQLLITSSPLLFEEMPEIPLAAKQRPVRVRNRTEGNRLDLEIRYRNFDGDQVGATFEGKKPAPVSRRNGSTMGHSRHEVLAVLDLSHRSFGERASIAIGGRPYRIRRALGVQPLQLAIRQVQGGVAEGSFEHEAPEGRVTRHRREKRDDARVTWEVERGEDRVVVRQSSELRTLVYRYRRGRNGALELFEAAVEFWNAEEPIFRMRFHPALPDVRRSFEGTARSRWVVDVGDETGHAIGEVRTRSSGRRATMHIDGTKPWWVADRCTTSELEFAESGETRVQTTVEPCAE